MEKRSLCRVSLQSVAVAALGLSILSAQIDYAFGGRYGSYNRPVDGGYTTWSAYGDCSASCGGGMQTRTRSCTSPSPAYGGAQCVGAATHSIECNVDVPCPVDGGYTTWSAYGDCSASCGGGIQTRTRSCTSPSPAYGGAQCVGDVSETVRCNEDVQCAVAGGWISWNSWSPCSNTCGQGQNTRTRTCTSPSPAYGGALCHGDRTETRDCKHRYPCPQAGEWSAWGAWSVCAGSCSNSRQARIRTCTDPAPMFGGARCDGRSMSTRSCVNTRSYCKPTTQDSANAYRSY